nr:MAG TPA: hypothetical protein [Caudoviricetes sp.]
MFLNLLIIIILVLIFELLLNIIKIIAKIYLDEIRNL